ncbi:MAG: UbiA prenyltransferase family protein [archaeon]|nr:UbiA prenyltransferase family protein [archaeon]
MKLRPGGGIKREGLKKGKCWFSILRSKPQPFSFTCASLVGLFLGARGIPSPQIILLVGSLAYLISTSIYVFNDAVEVQIDRVNVQGTTKRPLTTGEATRGDALALAGLAGFSGLILAASLSSLTFFLASLALSLGIAYSAPKIYLKKRFPHKTLVIAVSSTLAPLTGASYFSIFDVGVVLATGTTSSYIIAMAIINDFRDMGGDRAFGIRTLPLVLGPSVSLFL